METLNYCTRTEAGLILRCSTKKIDRLIRDGRIKAFKNGRSVLIYADSLTEENINATKPKFL
ncbi:helix-turn-helix domain-containing protein [Lutibacter sp.]|uniref:helix-turn-helix domain-containing protein n=1 Tax=Lutibacter sp. TaxID=1925666 RepID=UPI0025B7B7A1|nr:helix-turn-helix domain-containing protein [Lutibacter sp.]MCF6180507.1 helix-turn-helix domain-containing protein [Lutibacter sp.]